jgi:ParB-like chromosome segregation protein Spo0J
MGGHSAKDAERAANPGTISEAVKAATEDVPTRDDRPNDAGSSESATGTFHAGVAQRSVDELHLHPRADEVPDMDGDQYAELLADVERVGVIEPLQILDDCTIVDGRHRWLAAKEAGIKTLPCVLLPGMSPDAAFGRMVAGALLRRHLTASQRAALAVKLAAIRAVREEAEQRQIATRFGHVKERQDTVGQDLGRPQAQRTREAIADVAGVSHETARQALDLGQHAPDLLDEVANGKKTVHAAAQEMKRRRAGPEKEKIASGSHEPRRRRSANAPTESPDDVAGRKPVDARELVADLDRALTTMHRAVEAATKRHVELREELPDQAGKRLERRLRRVAGELTILAEFLAGRP